MALPSTVCQATVNAWVLPWLRLTVNATGVVPPLPSVTGAGSAMRIWQSCTAAVVLAAGELTPATVATTL